MYHFINHKIDVSKSCVDGWNCGCVAGGWVNLSHSHCYWFLDIVVMYPPV